MIPSELQIGDTWEWTATIADYPASIWTLKFALRGLNLSVIDITAVAAGNDYAATVAADVTKDYLKGKYSWTAFVEKGTGATLERHTVDQGSVTLLPYLGAATSATDLRSHAQKMLDGIEATLEGRATHADLALTVNGRSIQYMKPEELTRWRSVYRSEVSREKGTNKTIRVEFGRA